MRLKDGQCCAVVVTSYMPRAMLRVNYFLYFKNSQDLKVLDFFLQSYTQESQVWLQRLTQE
jgi:hypothetical protein